MDGSMMGSSQGMALGDVSAGLGGNFAGQMQGQMQGYDLLPVTMDGMQGMPMTPPGMLMAGGMGPGAVGPMGGPMPQNRGAGGGGGGGSRGARGGRGRNFPGPVPAMGGPGMPGTGHAIPGTKRPDFVPGSLFIGDLSDKTTADTLRSYCSTWGDLKECRVIEGKGYGFVVYERPESAIAFLEHRQQNGHILDGVTIDPRAQAPKGQSGGGKHPSSKIFVGALGDMTDEEFHAYFSRFGKIVEANVIREHRTQKCKGYGFVTFADSLDVDKCLMTKHVMPNGLEADVKRTAQEEPERRDGGRQGGGPRGRGGGGGLGPGAGGMRGGVRVGAPGISPAMGAVPSMGMLGGAMASPMGGMNGMGMGGGMMGPGMGMVGNSMVGNGLMGMAGMGGMPGMAAMGGVPMGGVGMAGMGGMMGMGNVGAGMPGGLAGGMGGMGNVVLGSMGYDASGLQGFAVPQGYDVSGMQALGMGSMQPGMGSGGMGVGMSPTMGVNMMGMPGGNMGMMAGNMGGMTMSGGMGGVGSMGMMGGRDGMGADTGAGGGTPGTGPTAETNSGSSYVGMPRTVGGGGGSGGGGSGGGGGAGGRSSRPPNQRYSPY